MSRKRKVIDDSSDDEQDTTKACFNEEPTTIISKAQTKTNKTIQTRSNKAPSPLYMDESSSDDDIILDDISDDEAGRNSDRDEENSCSDDADDCAERFSRIEKAVREKMNVSNGNEKRLMVHSIELQGFKSYREKTIVGPFSEQHNCIIGSNGSGKSNLIDAICFVFGFDSKDLRAKNLRSLIHHHFVETGMDAHVRVRFNVLAKNSSEIIETFEIERRIVASEANGSHYTLTKGKESTQTKSKKEVRALLKSYGLDFDYPERFIVLQHNTIKMVKQKPQEMLEHLEHLFGTDVIREEVQIIENEISLEIDKFDKNEARLRELENAVEELRPKIHLFRSYEELKEKMETINQKIRERSYQNTHYRFLKTKYDLEATVTSLISLKELISKEIATKETTQSKVKVLETKHRTLIEKTESTKRDITYLQKTIAKLKAECKVLTRKREGLIDKLKKENKLLSDLTEEESLASTSSRSIQSNIELLSHHLSELKEQKNKLVGLFEKYNNAQFMNALDSINTIKLDNAFQTLKNRIELKGNLVTDMKSLECTLSELQSNLGTIEKDHQSKSHIVIWTEKIIEDLVSELRHLHQSHQEMDIKRECIVEQITKLSKTLQQLNRVEEHNSFLKAVTGAKGVCKGCFGTLSDIFKITEMKYYRAVNTVLAPLLKRTVVVDRRDSALQVVKYFEENKLGIVACEILEEVHCQETQEITKAKTLNSVIGCDEMFKPLLRKITQSWYICEDITSAKDYSYSRNARRNVVTLNGELFRTTGEISSVAFDIFRSKNMSLIQCHGVYGNSDSTEFQTIDIVRKEKQECEQALQMHTMSMNELETTIQSIKVKLNQNKKQLQMQKDQLLSLEKDITSIKQQLEGFYSERTNLHSQILEVELTSLEEIEYNAYLKNIEHYGHVLEEHKELYAQKIELEQVNSKKLVTEKEIEDLKQELWSKSKRLMAIPQKKESSLEQVIKLEKDIEELETKINQSELKQEEKKLKKQKKLLHSMEQEVEEEQASWSSCKELLEDTIAKIVDLEQQKKEAKQLKSNLKSKLDSLKSDLTQQKKQLRLAKIQVEDFSAFDIHHSEKLLQRMQVELGLLGDELHKMEGTVDKTCISEEKVVKKEIATVKKNCTKLTNHIQTLRNLSERLVALRYEVFHQVCDTINKALSQTFKDMSINSNCYIAYCQTDRKKTFEQGISIYCKPDGEWKHFSKLSGGQQSLCCASLALSMMRCFPTPICFFDELDSSLDTINVERFSKLLMEYSNNTQFICISFKFYEVADRIIGVYHNNGTSCTVTLALH